ncbi:MAG: hypothetical protein ACTSYX_04805 [Candidatus Thorarchaeota archaeon]
MDWAIILAVLFTALFVAPLVGCMRLLTGLVPSPRTKDDEIRRLRHDVAVWRKRYYRLKREMMTCNAD